MNRYSGMLESMVGRWRKKYNVGARDSTRLSKSLAASSHQAYEAVTMMSGIFRTLTWKLQTPLRSFHQEPRHDEVQSASLHILGEYSAKIPQSHDELPRWKYATAYCGR